MKKLDFEIDCPHLHNQTVSFTEEEFEELLKAGLEFHCNTCDTSWPPTHAEIAHFRRQFAKHTV